VDWHDERVHVAVGERIDEPSLLAQHDELRVGEPVIPLPQCAAAFRGRVIGILARQFVDVIDPLAAGDLLANESPVSSVTRSPLE
jgi:hypothetical protein